MSAAEELVWEPGAVDEAERTRQEDPGFAVVLARCRARARGEDYSPERHGPFDLKRAPRPTKEAQQSVAESLGDIMGRFMERGGRKLTLVRDRDDVRRVASQ